MRNRAKCKLCSSVIESFHSTDYVICKCDEIFVDGGESMKCGSKHWENFIRLDDLDYEIIPEVIEKDLIDDKKKVTKKDVKELIDSLIKTIEALPDVAKQNNINHYDMLSLLYLMSSSLDAD